MPIEPRRRVDRARQPAPRTRGGRRTARVFETEFSADPLAVRTALRSALARFLRQMTEDEAGTLELVLAEVMNNIVEHGYADAPQGRIALRIRRDGPWLACAVSDDGAPLPQSCLERCEAPDPMVAPCALSEGGFGWFLIHDLTCDLAYRREAGRNELAFRLPLGAKTAVLEGEGA